MYKGTRKSTVLILNAEEKFYTEVKVRQIFESVCYKSVVFTRILNKNILLTELRQIFIGQWRWKFF